MNPTLEQVDIPSLERFDLYAYLGLVRIMEPDTEMLMRERADAEHAGDEYDSPHSRPWFVSMHGSEFPGEPLSACKRYLTYRMMNFPGGEAVQPWVTTTGTVGKAGELDIADAWWKGGRLLAIPEDPEIKQARLEAVQAAVMAGDLERARDFAQREDIHQLGFVRPDLWFTVSTDLPILKPGWTRPHIIEVKGKADDVVEEMLNGRIIQRPDGKLEKVGRGPDKKHEIQLKATVGEAHDYDWGQVMVCRHSWRILWSELHVRLGQPGGVVMGVLERNGQVSCPEHGWDCRHTFHLEPPLSGSVYYWSRSWPRKTKEFYFEYDPDFMAVGRQVLAEARQAYIDDRIPERPAHFQWGVGACQFCQFKPFCRSDSGVPGRLRKPRPEIMRAKLTESHGVDATREIRPHYDPEATRQRVFQEWDFSPKGSMDAALEGSDQ